MSMLDGCGVWCVRLGDVVGTLLDVLGLGSRAGRVCAICVPQVKFESATLCYYYVRRSHVSLFDQKAQ